MSYQSVFKPTENVLIALIAMLACSPAIGQSAVLTEAAKIQSGNTPLDFDVFGFSVSIDDDTAIIGEPFDDVTFDSSGSAYIFTRSATGVWTKHSRLNAADPGFSDNFGHQVVIDGDTALISSPDDRDNGFESGSAYIFIRNPDGSWSQQAKLLAPDGSEEDHLGYSADLSGDTAILGASRDDDNGGNSGSAYVFVRDSSGTWSLQSKLRASDANAGDLFGYRVALDGSTAVVGAVLEDEKATDAGAAYVFVRDSSGTWTQQAKLLAQDGAANNLFGEDIAVQGNTALIGAVNVTTSPGGAVYVFVRGTANLWTQQAKLSSSDGADDDFGASLDLEEDTAAIGAWVHSHGDFMTGAGYIFKRDSAGTWTEQYELLASDRQRGMALTGSDGGIAVSGNTVIAGAYFPGNTILGSAYIFELAPPAPPDADGDGVPDATDNCISNANSDQTDTDSDGLGDACDPDNDNDGVVDNTDNCKFTPNPTQSDQDHDGIGDECDADRDGDGVVGPADNCPQVPNADQTNTDGDAKGDDCDTDDDNDNVCDTDVPTGSCSAGPDNCRTIFNSDQQDLEGDGIGDACDADLDNDGVENAADNCPVDSNVDQNDTDGDATGDVCDADIDNDLVANSNDNCPYLANADQADLDNDGLGNVCDLDVDGDGIATNFDNCPTVPNSNQLDFDGDGNGDACDSDVDGDQVVDTLDQCGLTPGDAVVDPQSGCSIAQLCPCAGPAGTTVSWQNHGKYVSCVAHVSGDFAAAQLITTATKDAIVAAAAQSSCGSK